MNSFPVDPLSRENRALGELTWLESAAHPAWGVAGVRAYHGRRIEVADGWAYLGLRDDGAMVGHEAIAPKLGHQHGTPDVGQAVDLLGGIGRVSGPPVGRVLDATAYVGSGHRADCATLTDGFGGNCYQGCLLLITPRTKGHRQRRTLDQQAPAPTAWHLRFYTYRKIGRTAHELAHPSTPIAAASWCRAGNRDRPRMLSWGHIWAIYCAVRIEPAADSRRTFRSMNILSRAKLRHAQFSRMSSFGARTCATSTSQSLTGYGNSVKTSRQLSAVASS